MKLKKQGLEAFRFSNKQWYFKNEKWEMFYNLLFLIAGSTIFYFVYIVLYAIMQDINI